MSRRRAAQVGAITALAIMGVALLFGVIRVGALVIAAQTAVATEPQVEVPETLALPNATWTDVARVELLAGGPDGPLRAYGEVWSELDAAHSSTGAVRLDRFFVDPALSQVRDSLDTSRGSISIVDGVHTLEPVYAHPEGWLVTFIDRDAAISRTVDGITLATIETFEVTMVFDRGRWMVRSMIRLESEPDV